MGGPCREGQKAINDQRGCGKSQRYHGHYWGDGCAHYVGQRPYIKLSRRETNQFEEEWLS